MQGNGGCCSRQHLPAQSVLLIQTSHASWVTVNRINYQIVVASATVVVEWCIRRPTLLAHHIWVYDQQSQHQKKGGGFLRTTQKIHLIYGHEVQYQDFFAYCKLCNWLCHTALRYTLYSKPNLTQFIKQFHVSRSWLVSEAVAMSRFLWGYYADSVLL